MGGMYQDVFADLGDGTYLCQLEIRVSLFFVFCQNFEIQRPTAGEAGQYRCNIRNDQGETNANLKLDFQQEEAPSDSGRRSKTPSRYHIFLADSSVFRVFFPIIVFECISSNFRVFHAFRVVFQSISSQYGCCSDPEHPRKSIARAHQAMGRNVDGTNPSRAKGRHASTSARGPRPQRKRRQTGAED